jgi:hypothetical protein
MGGAPVFTAVTIRPGRRRNDGREKVDLESTPTNSLGFEPRVI